MTPASAGGRLLVLTLQHGCANPHGAEPIEDTVEETLEETAEEIAPLEVSCEVHRPPSGVSASMPLQFTTRILDGADGPTSCFGADDLDKDGNVDLWWGQGEPPAIELLWGRGDGSFDRTEAEVPEPPVTCVMLRDAAEGTLWVASASQISGLTVLPDRTTRPTPQNLYESFGAEAHAIVAIDLDDEAGKELIIARGGEANVCIVPETEADGDVKLPSDQRRPADLLCLKHQAGVWAPAPELCPSAFDGFDASFSFAISLQDLNDDAQPEILVTGDFGTSRFAISGADGWSDGGLSSGLQRYGHAMGAAWGDLDGDGLRDLYVTDYGPDEYFANLDCELFYDAAAVRGVADGTRYTITWGVGAFDPDLDGDLDIVVAQNVETDAETFRRSICDIVASGADAPGPFLLRNDGAGAFPGRQTLFDYPGQAKEQPMRVVVADLDNDGKLDVVTGQRDKGLFAHLNRTATTGRWIAVRPELADGSPAWGARVVLHEGEGERARIVELWPEAHTTGQLPPQAHFGLGDGPGGALTASIRWPDGSWTDAQVPINALTTVRR